MAQLCNDVSAACCDDLASRRAKLDNGWVMSLARLTKSTACERKPDTGEMIGLSH